MRLMSARCFAVGGIRVNSGLLDAKDASGLSRQCENLKLDLEKIAVA